ncbi:MAG: NfeD family protein [Planctomycetota bacterium]
MEPMLIWGLSLIAVSVLLIVVELFVPSGGIIALTAGVVGVAGVVCLFLTDRNPVLWGSLGILTLVVLFPSAFFLWVKLLPTTSWGQALLGERPIEERQSLADREQEQRDLMRSLVGEQGVALTPLRPVGTIEVSGSRYDALAEGVAIEQGDAVRVTGADITQLRVRPATTA